MDAQLFEGLKTLLTLILAPLGSFLVLWFGSPKIAKVIEKHRADLALENKLIELRISAIVEVLNLLDSWSLNIVRLSGWRGRFTGDIPGEAEELQELEQEVDEDQARVTEMIAGRRTLVGQDVGTELVCLARMVEGLAGFARPGSKDAFDKTALLIRDARMEIDFYLGVLRGTEKSRPAAKALEQLHAIQDAVSHPRS